MVKIRIQMPFEVTMDPRNPLSVVVEGDIDDVSEVLDQLGEGVQEWLRTTDPSVILEAVSIEDVISYYGTNELLSAIGEIEIKNYEDELRFQKVTLTKYQKTKTKFSDDRSLT